MYINVFLVVYEYLTDGNLGLSEVDGRYSGLIENANDVGFLLIILINFEFYFLKEQRLKISVLGIIMGSSAIFVTFSKTALIIAILVLFIVFKNELLSGYLFTKAVLLLSLAFVIGEILNFDQIFDSLEKIQGDRLVELTDIFTGRVDEQTTSKRSYIIQIAIEQLSENWIYGQVIATFPHIHRLGIGCHNIYL
ncbi:hypothetical protein N8648_05200 [Verrucomicrobia bacterium]|nr:hypothetical protein [Verrucomicrobiota bacterium]